EKLDGICKQGAILATNTSGLDVDEIAAVTKRPEDVIGLHFFSPANVMRLLEIVRADKTAKDVLATCVKMAKAIRKVGVVSGVCHGFIGNRMLGGYGREAEAMILEGATPSQVDKAVFDFGMPMGPFTLSDEVGLDVGIKVLYTLEESLGGRFAPVESFKRIFEAGLLGKKTKKGFYTYSGKESDPNEAIGPLLGDDATAPFLDEDYRKRMIYLMINEAARCLEDSVVDDPGAIDVGMIFGTGFPPFRGGLLRYADSVGIGNIVADLERFANEGNKKQLEPCTYLLSLRDQAKGFYSA
ncbi:MAG: 3-hydroxyacyl-CoA dehydrogenase, partial [Hyphomicrobiaceae bacterium]|nr:3-hydroxyacyl-CoA dehydrogenase [Hyphomicrobiaceae bacterium]